MVAIWRRRNGREVGRVADVPAINHIALTVTNLGVSAPWYERLLGVTPLVDEDTGEYRHIVYQMPGGLILALHEHPTTNPEQRFSEYRPGLDHLSFGCADRAELETWRARLEDFGIHHGGIVESPYGAALSFRDPDNIALEVWLPS
jgi:catechol-2,3-dioxygenase